MASPTEKRVASVKGRAGHTNQLTLALIAIFEQQRKPDKTLGFMKYCEKSYRYRVCREKGGW
jgi:hypothetical protein